MSKYNVVNKYIFVTEEGSYFSIRLVSLDLKQKYWSLRKACCREQEECFKNSQSKGKSKSEILSVL